MGAAERFTNSGLGTVTIDADTLMGSLIDCEQRPTVAETIPRSGMNEIPDAARRANSRTRPRLRSGGGVISYMRSRLPTV